MHIPHHVPTATIQVAAFECQNGVCTQACVIDIPEIKHLYHIM